MSSLKDKFSALSTDDAPGQEVRKADAATFPMRGGLLGGAPVDFSHGNVDAFVPPPGAVDLFLGGVDAGGRQAYTEYRGSADIRRHLANRLAAFTGKAVAWDEECIITPGTQGALFLALASTIANGDRVVIIEPDYFANRKLVRFLGGTVVPVGLAYLEDGGRAGLDLGQLAAAFESGAKLMVFSNPNNPTGAVYSADEIAQIARLAGEHGATVIVDQLYARLLYDDAAYTHLRRAAPTDNVVTIMGPSKTESLSGFRLGVAFGASSVIARMEKLQAIVSLRAPGYNQAVLCGWFDEPEGWMADRIEQHRAIRDDLVALFRAAHLAVRVPQAGSYLFPTLPALEPDLRDFVGLLRRQANVVVTPGTEFDPKVDRAIRLNFSQDRPAAVAAAGRIIEMIDRYRR